jgi:hypothetical protein
VWQILKRFKMLQNSVCNQFFNTLFNGAFTVETIQSDTAMSDELKRIWKEVLCCLINVLSQHFLGGTEESTKHLSG